MSGNDMNAEQGGSTPEGDFSPVDTGSAEAKDINQPDSVEAPTGDSFSKISSETTKDDSDSSKIESVRQDLRFDSKGNFVLTPVTAGGLGLENDDPKSSRVLQAHVPGRPAGRKGQIGNAGAAGGRNPLGGIRGRIVAAVTTLGLMLGGGAAYVANQQASSGENNPGAVPTQPVGETPDIKTVEPTSKPTEQPKTPTPESTPTEVAPGPGSYGKYETIDQLPLDEERKNAIKELTKDTTPFIITDQGMVVIENSMFNRPEKIQYYDEQLSVSQLHEILLNTDKYPNAQEEFDKALEMAKYEAWKNQSGSRVTFEEYLFSKETEQHKFEVWGYDGTSENLDFHSLDDDAFVIIKYLSGIDRTNIIWSRGAEMSNEVIGNVVSVGLFTVHPSGEGFTDNSGVDLEKYYCAPEIAAALASLGANVNENIVGGKFSLAGQTTGDGKLQDSLNNLTQALLPQFEGNPNPPSTEGWEAIFTVKGTPYKRN